MNKEHPKGIDRQNQMLNGLQTNIEGNVHGAVFSGVFNAPVTITSAFQPIVLSADDLQGYKGNYFRQIAEECAYLYTEGVDRKKARLEQVFMEPDVVLVQSGELQFDVHKVNEQNHRDSPRKSLPDSEESRLSHSNSITVPIAASVALQSQSHLVILGDPGTGKTTLLRFLAFHFSEPGLKQEEPAITEERIPVFCELRSYDGSYSVSELLIRAVADLGLFDPMPELCQQIACALVQQWLTEGRLLLLLDGLDEVPIQYRKSVIDSINRFANTPEGSRCKVVVTSRLSGYLESIHGFGSMFCVYSIQPFWGVEKKQSYATLWIRLICDVDQEKAQWMANELLLKLQLSSGMHQVADNPLFLRLAIASYCQGYSFNGQLELYRRYLEEVLATREQGRNTTRWSKAQLEDCLQHIAWTLQTKGQQTMQVLAGMLSHENTNNGEDLLRYLRERLGILATFGYEQGILVDFRHSTFREYFVAQRLATTWRSDCKRTWHFLHPRLHHPEWREAILFLVEVLGNTDATVLVKQILNARSPYEKELHRDLQLAAACLTTVAEIDPGVRGIILTQLLRLYLEWLSVQVKYPKDIGVDLKGAIQRAEAAFSTTHDDERAEITRILLDVSQSGYWDSEGLFKRSGGSLYRYVQQLPFFIHLSILFEVRFGLTIFYSQSYWQQSIQALKNLRLQQPAVIERLMQALQEPMLAAVAADALVTLGSDSIAIAEALLNAVSLLRRSGMYYSDGEKVLVSLGRLAQKHPRVAQYLMELAEPRDCQVYDVLYRVGYALCKAAEVNVAVTAFILRLYGARFAHTALVDDGLYEGLKDGAVQFKHPSLEVIQHLLQDEVAGQHWSPIDLLSQVTEDGPRVSCIKVEEDGSESYVTEDITDYVFDAFLQRPYRYMPSSRILQILATWALSDKTVMARLLNHIRDSDPWLLAQLLENKEFVSSFSHFDGTVTEHILHRQVERLKDHDSQVREAEFCVFVEAFQRGGKSLHATTANIKCRILFTAYSSAYHRFWQFMSDSKLSRRHTDHPNAHLFAALSCFRGWRDSEYWMYRLTDNEICSMLDSQVEDALSLISCEDSRVVHRLSSILLGDEINIAYLDRSGNLDKRMETSSRYSRKPEYTEQVAAIYALSLLYPIYPEARRVLLSYVDYNLWQDCDNRPTYDLQMDLIKALGYVKCADREVISILLKTQSTVGFNVIFATAGVQAIGCLEKLDSDAVDLLVESYNDLGEWARHEVINVLGKSKPYVEKTIDLLLHALRDPSREIRHAAARALENLGNLNTRVIEELLNVSHNSLFDLWSSGGRALIALAMLASHISSVEELRQFSRRFHKSARKAHASDARCLIYEVLSGTARRLTELEVAELLDELTV